MTEQNSTNPSRFPTFRRCVRILFTRWTLYALIVLVTLFALFHAEENFRGQRAWDRYRKDAEARGVKFDFAAFIPAPVPDDQNAANNWVVQSWFPRAQPNDPNWPTLIAEAEQRIASRKNNPDRRATEHFADLVAMQEAMADVLSGTKKKGRNLAEQDRSPQERAQAAVAVLDNLKAYQPALDELRSTSRRPHVRFPIDYKLDDPFSILLPHLAKIKGVVQELKLQADAELAAGRVDDAFADVMFMIWLSDSMREEPFLIDQLVRIACLHIAVQPIWEGLAEHKWTDAQLQQLQHRLQQFDFVSDIAAPMNSERAAAVGLIERLARNRRSRPDINDLFSAGDQPSVQSGSAVRVASLIPRGWFYFEALNYCTMMDDQMKDGVNYQKKTINARQVEENHERMERSLKDAKGLDLILSHRFFARLLLPALRNATRKFAMAQVTATEGAMACALERYRLANGQFPETLDALAPGFMTSLPHDVLTGEPLKYERGRDGGFVLSSVGWPTREGKDRPGDWVWHMDPVPTTNHSE